MLVALCLIFLILLQFKHWIVDFVIQNPPISKHRFFGIKSTIHSIQHGVGTFIASVLVFPEFGLLALSLGLLDTVLHQLIDWGKMHNEEMKQSFECGYFINGCDQLMHQMCYIGYVVIIRWYVF